MALTEAQKAERAAARRRKAALAAESDAHRREKMRQRWRDEDMFLTREEARSGAPCRACGLPVIDNLGNWPGTMYLTDEERIEYDATNALFEKMHPACGTGRWSMDGSRATHCLLCCPPLPLSESQIETITRILTDSPRNEADLDVWKLTLTCGHVTERTSHRTNNGFNARTVSCTECDATRGVVETVKVETAATRRRDAELARAAEIVKAEREVKKAEKAAREAQRRLEQLRDSLG
ncbi:hypothetical protein GCM10010922_02810 [Microbacterium sorbitolivorans]|uniref:hypothetical protein n=1 Tax=Microbacterium sorbitolivorans TaxID=1867410 RepID=UPI0013B06A11|nr:hypothetical protein [Microbacterium sorbitolivorans]GGF31194.1 hypothetical protein GCM10010922_02810 [Microbacterium sorbitolivorans]